MLRKIYKDSDIEVFTNALGKIDERMYIVKRGSELIVVDPNVCGDLLWKMDDWSIRHCTILLTHEHYDHITGVKWLLDHRKGTVICSSDCGKAINNPVISVQDYYDILIPEEDKEYYVNCGLEYTENYVYDVDISFGTTYSFVWQGMNIQCRIAPGHSAGGAIYLMDNRFAFTGDNLVNGNKVITRFPGGNREDYLRITKPIIQSMAENCLIFPGHGEMGPLRELKQYII